jgi:hypothetical protein
MPSLKKLLQSYDIDLLMRIAHSWGFDDDLSSRDQVEEWLLKTMTDNESLSELVNSLPETTLKAWQTLKVSNGRIPWSEFTRQFGNLRSLGPAARQREKPDLHPLDAAEELYYRGLIGRAFLDAHPEPREYAFIPQEIFGYSATTRPDITFPAVRPVSQSEIKRHQPANTRLMDHVIDWLSCLRMKKALPGEYFDNAKVTKSFIKAISLTGGLVTNKYEILTEETAIFLQTNRVNTVKEWFSNWRDSSAINDLLMIPGLEFEGVWRNDAVFSRNFILQILKKFDLQTWYSIASFVSNVEKTEPDFQRPAGNFDTWSIRKAGSSTYLVGRQYWNEIDGAYIRYLLSGPLHWLGVLDLAFGTEMTLPTAFRLSPLARFLLEDNTKKPSLATEVAPKLAADLTITLPINTSPLVRYQVGRFTQIVSNSVTESRHQVTAASLTTAESSGLKIDQLNQLLEKHIKSPLPQSFNKLAQRWNKNQLEAMFEKAELLRVEDPGLIKMLADHPRTARMIKEIITPQVAVMQPGGREIAQKVLLESGILSQTELDV